MLCLKKLYREELLQLALLLSLLRVDPESYLGFDIQAMGVGSLDLHNGSGWHTDAHTIVHRPMFVHPKNLDSVLLNYERDLFEDLNSLGRYNRMNSGSNDIHAYLLNVEDTGRNAATAGSSLPISTGTSSNMTSPDSSSSSQQPAEPIGAAELTQEDMDLIEVLWKQDVDLGFTLVEPTSTTSKKKVTTSCEKESEDEIEKLKALEAINATNQKDDPEGVEVKHQDDDDPWAGRNYTVDLETGEYILSSCNQNVGNNNEIEEEEEEDNQLLREQSSFGLNHHPLAGFSDDSLGLNETLGLENDFTSELLSGSLLGSTVVEDFLGGNDLGLPDGFNLEEALQLVGLDEVKPDNEETKYELKREKEEEEEEKKKEKKEVVKQEEIKQEELLIEENEDGKQGGGGTGGGGVGGDEEEEEEDIEDEDEEEENFYENYEEDEDEDEEHEHEQEHEDDEEEEEEEEVVVIGSKEFTNAKGDVFPVNVSGNVAEVAKSSRCEDPETGDMIHTPQFHHPHHPHHHRSFQDNDPEPSLPVAVAVAVAVAVSMYSVGYCHSLDYATYFYGIHNDHDYYLLFGLPNVPTEIS
ncbi:hypothetical protein M0804_010303 [Polistes exclamans]|nr:hypothetical protein M0804_010303 [Polistes exclamans]